MTFLITALLLAAASGSPPAASQSAWRDEKGAPVEQTESSKSVSGFSAMLLVTPDTDWQKKWATPSETVPEFSSTDKVSHNGDKLFVLTFLSNPGTLPSGDANVFCDLAIIRPDGTFSTNQTNIPCFQSKLQGGTDNIYLSPAVVTYLTEPSDKRGVWIVKMNLHDKVRGVTLPLRTSFTVE